MLHKLLLGVALCCTSFANSASADRPACYKLLPSKTLAYVRIADLKELGERFSETTMGRIAQEEEIQSLTKQLYEELENAFTPVAEELGLTLSQLLAIPSGEIAFAAVAPPTGFPAPVLMVDIEGQEANAIQLLDVLQQKIEENQDFEKSQQAIRGTKVTIYAQDEDPRFTGIVFFRKDSMFVGTSNIEVAEQILAAWDGDSEQEILEDNEDFANVMRHSKGPRDAVPQIRWFIDPISFAKVAMRGNAGAQMALATLPVVGLDGLLALGGSFTFATEEYDSFVQMHIITQEPRTGVLRAMALKSGDTTPEDWVPHDVAGYMTLHWDFNRTREEVQVLYDSFAGEDAFQNQVLNQANERLELDVLQDVIGALSGRVTLATWYPRPVRINGVAYLGGIHFKKDSKAEKTFNHIIERVGQQLEQKPYGGFTIYAGPTFGEEPDPAEPNPFAMMPQQPCLAFVDDCLLLSNRPEFLERAIVSRSNSAKELADELDFKLIASKVRRQPGGKTPALFSFQRPEQALRMLYELATADSTRQSLAGAAENNAFLGRINQAIEENPLPPFEKLRKFVAPGGSIMTVDDKGFHYIGFGLRRK